MKQEDILPRGSSLIPYGSPLHVTELVLLMLKQTFAEFPEDYPYRFVPGNFEASGIAFDVPYNKDSEIFGKKPIIVVSRGAQSTAPVAISDRASQDYKTRDKVGSTLIRSSVNVRITSKAKAEVEVLSQLVFHLLMYFRVHLPRYLGVHMASDVMLSEVRQMEDDDEIFTTELTCSYTTQPKWDDKNLLEAPLLRTVQTHFTYRR